MKRFKRHAALVACILFMGGCASPGSPLLRESTAGGEGPLVPDCKNVSSAAKVTEYITNFYLSTYGSAFAEGGNEGFAEVLSQRSPAPSLT
jgi:hypothetical protein